MLSCLGKLSVAVLHPRMGRGGSEATAMWTLEALKRDYCVALIAGGPIDLHALNAFYGTSVEPADCKVVQVPIPWPLSGAGWGDALRSAFAARGMRPHLDRFDVLINAYNLGSFGRRGIHLLADFSWDEALRRRHHPVPSGLRRLAHVVQPLRRSYLAACRSIAGPEPNPALRGAGTVIANSEWSRSKLREILGIESRVVYPPVAIRLRDWQAVRRSDFVCIGRIAPEKRIERIVAILSRVRARGHGVRLRIIGEFGKNAYAGEIARLVRNNCQWISLEGARFGGEKEGILGECAFGISACEGETFGIAVAEMVRTGCIPFASAVGGPAEILDHPALLYRGEDEAVEKICAVLENDRLGAELRAHLRGQAEKFSSENFVAAIRETVAEFRGRSTVPTAALRSKEAFEC